MKVLYLHQHFTTPSGSTGTRSYEFSRALLKRGHSVTIVCGSHHLAKTGLTGDYKKHIRRGFIHTPEGQIEIIEINQPYSNHDGFVTRSLKFLKFSMRAIKLILTEKYDLLYATTTPLTIGIPAMAAKLFKNKKYIFEVRDLWPELPKAMGVIRNPVILKSMSVLEFGSYRLAKHCVGLSPGICEGIMKRGVKKHAVTLISNGCDENFLNKTKNLNKPAGFNPDDFIAVFTGAHGEANGLAVLLDVARELKILNIKNIKILLIGDGKEKSKLIKTAQEEDLNNLIFWDPVPKVELENILQQVDLGLMILKNIPAFYYGTSPNKFFDYIASGLPVLVNYPGWLADLINQNHCGVAVPPDDGKIFAQELIKLSEDKNLLKNMGESARDLAQREFSREVLAGKFVDCLERISHA